ncbi:hypothetical protein P4T89_09080 [Bacillus nakamurai]|uniref:Uncharacterized protein n=1 Tax=Bacillus nakamurai TaxID=1793963 RepID=A0A150F422_9BACI|nr:hypothetical protein [Bacillus nakamurai]KXZ16562.1 hypothetical protein AXI58_19835 [Bacillus nakamurai]MED1227739.1 hypothetical protein [Bacillus nakamurai]
MKKKSIMRKMVLSVVTSVVTISLALFPMIASASTTKSIAEVQSQPEKGEIILKYTAPDVDLSIATEEQLKTLKKIGWKMEDGELVQYRSISEEIDTAINEGYLSSYEDAEKMGLLAMDEEDEENKDTLLVDGKETEIKDGQFEVIGSPESVEIRYDENTTKNVKKSEDGKYRLVIEQDLGEVIDEMDEHSHDSDMEGMTHLSTQSSTIGTLGYGDKYKPGDWVHCNRFNGPHTDDRHLQKWHPQAIINFYHSDCDYGALRYCKSHKNCNQKYRAAYCSWKLGHSTKYHRH